MEGKDGFAAQLAAHMGVDHATLLAAMPGQGGVLTGTLIGPNEVACEVLLMSSPTMPSTICSNWLVDSSST